MANQLIMHWKVGDGRVACNTKRAIMYLPLDKFLEWPIPCKRCLARALKAKSRNDARAA